MAAENDDDLVWQEAVDGVKPLPPPKTVFAKSKKRVGIREKMQMVPLKFYRHELKLGTSADIDAHTMRRFKREEFAVEATLDLHGFNEEKAFEAVRQFVTRAYLRKNRCIMIVTGKGIRHPDEDIFASKGVLKERVPQWLARDELRQLILTFDHPSERLGGQGALYILLRRQRAR